ncbi:MAG TPA: PQQ-binding-like beta-propeller repeat protein, partial [Polyangiaceae bacterium]|nr:PQQ-binding-like beta-propeller repeat protein [Polyangiaceae bacterium]
MDSAAYANGVLYMASNEVVSAIDDPQPTDKHVILAVQADTAKTLWKKEKPYSSVGGLAYANGLVFNIANDGTLYAVDAKNGEELWKDELSVIENGERKKVVAASGPSIAGGKLFACHGFAFFKTGASPEVRGGLIAYGLPGGDDGGPEAAIDEDSGGTGGICETDAGVSECKRVGTAEGTCDEVVNCACEKCTCELERCQALPSCVAIRQCAIRTGCAANPISCYVGPAPCKDVIDQNGGAMAQATLLALQLGNCTTEQKCPVMCGDGGSSSDGGDAAREGGTTDASRDATSADVGPG